MNAVDIQGLTKRYSDMTAVDALSLTIGEGELFALLGVNGAGKSTAIKMLSGLTPPTEGDALLMGHGIREELDKVKRCINVSPQETAVAPKLSVRENLELVAGLHGADRRSAHEAAIRRYGGIFPPGNRKKGGGKAFRRLAAASQYCDGAYHEAADSVFG